MSKKKTLKCFPSASDSVKDATLCIVSPQTKSDSYKLAFDDPQFLLRDELRGVRLQLEIMKPDMIQQEHGIHSTIVIFGGTRIPDPATAAKRLQEEFGSHGIHRLGGEPAVLQMLAEQGESLFTRHQTMRQRLLPAGDDHA